MNANWKERLEQWAPEPPAKLWERMSENLADATQPLYAQKLHDFYAVPPESAWDAIATQLKPATVKPSIQLFPRRTVIRYGSIAASVLLAFFMFRQFNMRNPEVSTPIDPVLQQSVLPMPQKGANLQIAENEPPSGAINTTPEMRRMAALKSFMSAPHIDSDPVPTNRAETIHATSIYNIISAPAPQVNDENIERYIVLTVAEDAAVRLPKKLYDLFRCGDMPTTSGCQELLNHIRQQTATPSLLTSADFAGLLELIRQVDADR